MHSKRGCALCLVELALNSHALSHHRTLLCDCVRMTIGRNAMGILCILSVVLLWVGSSELIQTIFDSQQAHFRFESPLFLTFYSTSLFSIYLSGFIFCEHWRQICPGRRDNPRDDAQHEEEDVGLLDDSRVNSGVAAGEQVVEASAYQTMMLSAQFAPMWIAANLSFNSSLCRSCGTGTSVSSNTLLSSSSGVFTLIFSILVLGDEFSLWKLVCVLGSVGGVSLLVVFDGTKAQDQNIWGDLLALAGAAFMGAYSVQLKHMLGSRGSLSVSMPMFFGFLGVTAALLGLPIFAAVVVLGVKGWVSVSSVSRMRCYYRLAAVVEATCS